MTLENSPFPKAVARVNTPDPHNPGFRIVGYRVPDDTYDIAERLAMLEAWEQRRALLATYEITAEGIAAALRECAAPLAKDAAEIIARLQRTVQRQSRKLHEYEQAAVALRAGVE